jgi:hypothetical protein
MDLKIIKTLFLIGGIFALLSSPADSLDAKTSDEVNLYRVRKIFLETRTQGNGDLSEQGMVAFASLRPDLKKALLGYGFTVVDDLAEADAVMYGGNTIGWVVLDGPPIDPPKYGFQFWLSSAKYNFKWQTEFNIRSRGNRSEVSHKAVQKAARNFFRAWKKSAKNMGIVVGDSLP